jgi:tetratricopeptide (TPR) repeat protein
VRGATLRGLCRPIEALASYERATALEPLRAEGHLGRAAVLLELNRPADALESCDAAIALVPEQPVAHGIRGAALLALGRCTEALASLDVAIRLHPALWDAHVNRGAALRTLRRFEAALASYDRAVALRPGAATAHAGRAAALQALGRPAHALASYARAAELQPTNAAHCAAQAALELELGRADDALRSAEAALARRPDLAAAHATRAAALVALQRPEAALASFDEALRLGADTPRVHNGRALASLALGRLDEAIASCDRVIERGQAGDADESAAAYTHRGIALWSSGRFAAALASYDHAIALAPGLASAHGWRGAALVALQRPEEALASFDAALRHGEDTPAVHNGRAAALLALQRLPEAIASCDRVLGPGADGARAPAATAATAFTQRGLALQSLGRFDEALASFNEALRLRPELQGACVNAGTCQLRLGRFAAGWALFERRAKLDEAERPWSVTGPQWHGEPLEGKRLYVYYEQGLGDTIQFCRYAGLAAARGGQVVLAVQDRLLKLVSTLRPAVEVVAASAAPPAFDFHAPLLSLPGVFGTNFENIPGDGAYLRAEPERVHAWRERVGSHGFRIGINWQGSTRAIDRGRSFPLALLAPLAALPTVRLISLQRGPGREQLGILPSGMRVEDLGADFDQGDDAFLDTAAVMEHLDLVITSDTSIAHLAGALCRPTWMALRHVAEWRWFHDRDDSPWYARHRLFRQQRPGDWPGVFERMRAALLPLLGHR